MSEAEQIRRGIRMWLESRGVMERAERKRAVTRKHSEASQQPDCRRGLVLSYQTRRLPCARGGAGGQNVRLRQLSLGINTDQIHDGVFLWSLLMYWPVLSKDRVGSSRPAFHEP